MVRKVNILIDTSVITLLSGYGDRQQETVKAYMYVYTKSSEVWYKTSVNGADQPGFLPDAEGFNTQFTLKLQPGDIVRIEAYRVPDLFKDAVFVGSCIGEMTLDGFNAASLVNVTTKQTHKAIKKRVYK